MQWVLYRGTFLVQKTIAWMNRSAEDKVAAVKPVDEVCYNHVRLKYGVDTPLKNVLPAMCLGVCHAATKSVDNPGVDLSLFNMHHLVCEVGTI